MSLRLTVKAAVAAACLAAIGLTTSAGLAQTAPTAPTFVAPKIAPTPPAAGPATQVLPGAPVIPTTPATRVVPGQPLPPAELEAFVDGMVRNAMAGDHIAGVTVSVVQNGQVILKKGYGFASLSPARAVDPDRTLFRLASISKTFTWIALMKEVEAGRIRLDGPVNVYLPQKLQVPDQGFSQQQVRVRDLMTHTAGFEDRALGQLFERDPNRVRSLETYLLKERPNRVREPGRIPAYSNYGAALAGEAVSNVTGKPYEDLIEAEILRPLGLAHTTFREPRAAIPGLPAPLTGPLAQDVSDGYRWTNGGFEKRPPEFIGQVAPAASLSSTAGDMSRYMLLLLGGGTLDGVTIYGPNTARAFSTPLYRPLPAATGWNAGFQEMLLPGGWRGFGHGGSSVSFRSNLVVVPGLNLGVFIAANTESGHALERRLPGALIERFYLPVSELPPAPNPALYDLRERFEGTYLTSRRPYWRLEGFVTLLVSDHKVSVTREGYLVTRSDEGVRRWVPVGAADSGVFRAVDSAQRLVFDMSGERSPRYIAPWGGEAYERASPLLSKTLLAAFTVLTAVAAIATLGGLVLRDRRDSRESTSQNRASIMQTMQSVLYLLAMVCFAAWAAGTGDLAHVLYDWPSGWIITASASALVAFVLAVFTLVFMQPFIWRGGRRVDSWSDGRKLRFLATNLIFVGFGVLLTVWGAIQPWRA